MAISPEQHHTHEQHAHQHGPNCGHLRVQWEDKTGYLHDAHLHVAHGGHWDEGAIPISGRNPGTCNRAACVGHLEEHPAVPHGDHVDQVVDGRLHHRHGDHCDDHGPVDVSR